MAEENLSQIQKRLRSPRSAALEIPNEDLTPEPLELPPLQEAGDYQHLDISQINIIPARYS